jgi:hypothetical protein
MIIKGMKLKLLKYLLTLLIVCLVVLLSFIIVNWGQIKPVVGVYKEAIFSKVDANYTHAKSELAEIVNKNTNKSFNEIIDYTRSLVYENSIHKEDKEHDSYAFNKQSVTKRLWKATTGEDKPHLSCGPRVYAMKDILNELNIQSRVIDVIYNDGFNSHTVLEVFNHDTHRWQTHDPDNNRVFLDKNHSRLSGINILTKINNGIFNKQIVAVIVRETYDGKQNSLFYNPNRFQFTKNLVEYQKKLNTEISAKYNEPAIFVLTD